MSALLATFAEAKGYLATQNPTPTNLKFESMRGVFSGKQNLYVRADYSKDIIEAVKFAKSLAIPKIVIVGGEESHKVATFLKENNVPVILGELHRLPNREDEDVDMPYRQPGILQKAGVLVGLSYADGWWRTRNLAFLAGTAAGFGVTDKEEALKMVTSNNAKILGIDNLVGTLEKGKQATLFVSAGDALDMRTNVVEQVFIQGRKVNLDDRHKRLYKTYKDKYEQK
jgi:imidazolonepropionase-like amidohydrolase